MIMNPAVNSLGSWQPTKGKASIEPARQLPPGETGAPPELTPRGAARGLAVNSESPPVPTARHQSQKLPADRPASVPGGSLPP